MWCDVFVLLCRVFDLVLHKLVQTNVGHRDAVRSIIHIAERNQVGSALITFLFVVNL